VPREAAEEFGIFGHAAHVNLKDGKALLERGELLKELFLSDLLFRETAFVFVVSIETFHDDAPLCCVGSCKPTIGEARQVLAAAVSPLQSGDHSTTKAGLRTTGWDKL
jgi:hypothetical protein